MMNTLKTVFARIRNAAKNEEGVTALEYGMIAALIAAVIIGGVTSIGTSLNSTFSTISSKIGS